MIKHAFINPVADGTNSTIVRPSDWNSAHIHAMSIGGNTAGVSSFTANDVVFQGGNNVTLSANVAAGVATVLFSAASMPVYAATDITTNAVPVSQSSLFQQVSNTSAITVNAFPTANSSNLIPIASSANFQQTSNTSAITSNAFPSANTTKFAGTGTSATNASITANSNGIAVSVAAQSAQPVAFSASGGSSNFSTLGFSNANGVTFSNSGGSVALVHGLQYTSNTSAITANALATSQSSLFQHTSATSAITSNAFPSANTTKFAGTGFSGTNISGTVNSNGIALSVAAGGGGADGYNIIGINGASVGSAATIQLSNANNVSFGLNGSTITASASYPAQTVQPVAYSAANGSAAFSTLTFANSNGVSFSSGTQGLYATVKTDYLTTARASTDGIGLNTALTANGVSMTANSAGLSLNFPAFLTTAAVSNVTTNNLATSQSSLFQHTSATSAITSNAFPAANSTNLALVSHSHGNPTLALTNLSGTTASASNGFTISLSAAAPGGGGAINVSAGTTSGNLQTLQFGNGGGVSFGLNGSTVTASVDHGNVGVSNLGNTAGDTRVSDVGQGQLVFVGGNNITLSMATNGNSNTISIVGGAGGSPTAQSFWQPIPFNNTTTLAPLGQGTVVVWPAFQEGVASFSRGIVYISNSVSSSSNSSHAGAISLYLGLYTRNGSTLSLASSGSQSYQWTNTSNNSFASITAIRGLTVPIDASFNGGDIWCALMSKSGTTNANWFTARHIIASGMTNQLIGNIGEASNASRQMLPGWGQFTTTSAAMPASMAFSDIRGIGSGASNVGISPYINFVNMTA